MSAGREGRDVEGMPSVGPAALPGGSAARLPLFTAGYAMAVVAVHFYFVSYSMSLIEIPRFLEDEPSWVIGVVVGAFGVAGMLTRPLTGIWVDRGNRQFWVRFGAALTALSFAAYVVAPAPWATLVIRLIHGAAMGLFTTALLAIVTSRLPAGRRGLGIGMYQTANTVAALYAALLAGWLISGASFTVAFLVSAAAALLAMLFGALAGDSPPEAFEAVSGAGGGPVGPRRREWISRSALFPAIVFLSVTTPWGALNAFLPVFAEANDLGNVGLFYSVVAAAQLGARSSAGAISDRFGRSAVVIPGLGSSALGLLVLSSADTQAQLLVAAGLYGLGLAATQTAIVALIVDRTPVAQLGAGMATYTIAWDVGQVIGSILLGFIVSLTSYGGVFALSATFPVLGMLFFIARVRALPATVTSTGASEDAAAGT
jgi:MFS family permease